MTSEVTNSTEIKNVFITEAIKSAAFYSEDITEQQVITEVEQLLAQINAPGGLRGFYFVAQTLLQVLDAPGSTLQKQLEISDYVVAALRVDLQSLLSKPDNEQYSETSIGKNWAKSNPLYLVLFTANTFKGSTEDILFLAAFVSHYLMNIELLSDPEIQTTNHPRTEQVCRAIRILQPKSQTLFNVLHFHEYIKNWRASEIVLALEIFKQNNPLDKDTARYVRSLIQFFSNDWPKPRLRGQIGPQKNKREGSGIRVSARPEMVKSKTRVTPAPVQLDEQGVDQQDIEILRSHLSNQIEEETDRADYEQNSIAAIFDNDLQKLGSIDITRNLRQRNNLNTSNRLLLSAASIRLIKKLCESRLLKVGNNEAVLAIYCMLATGISLEQLTKLQIYTDEAAADNGIIVVAGQCYWRFKHRVSAVTPVGQPEYFYRSDTWVKTPCSVVLAEYINTQGLDAKTRLFSQTEQQLRRRIDKLLQRTTEKLRAPYISIDMIESFVSRFTEAADTVDPVVLDFSYQQELFSSRVSRSYVNLSDLQRMRLLDTLWQDIASYSRDDTVSAYFQPGPFIAAEEHRIGSRYLPTAEFCRQFTMQLQTDLHNAKPGSTLKLTDIVHYHNAYTRYTAWMLGFGTGYRAVYNPLPTLTLQVPDLQILSISDKDDGNFSHSRVVAVPNTLNQQLIFLKSHLIRLADLLTLFSPQLYQQVRDVLAMEQQLECMTKGQIEKWFKAIRNARDQIGPLFFLDEALNARPVSPTWLKTGNGVFQALPVNMGRHWLKTALLTSGVPTELVNFQMGHWQEGQSPLFEYSDISIMDCVAELAPQIDQLMTEQGWHACQSALL
ncbi:hypothetical protein [Arsukibacterium sp.]|uniref:hypothetical protein n=1 Tax=Arsukibacterium sp. TaxID=1977258 RepID=UPI0035674DA3